jgi:hypothetical protein
VGTSGRVVSCLARLQPFQRFRASMKPRAIQSCRQRSGNSGRVSKPSAECGGSVVLLLPVGDKYAGLEQGVELLDGQELVSKEVSP